MERPEWSDGGNRRGLPAPAVRRQAGAAPGTLQPQGAKLFW